MEQKNHQPDSKDPNETRPLQVAIIGFAEADQESFNRFFQVARIDKPKYILTSVSDQGHSDILMVNYDNLDALKEKDEILDKNNQLQIVAVSRGPLDEPPEHHIRGMLFAARVLTTLDKISITPRIEKALFQPQPDLETSTLEVRTALGDQPVLLVDQAAPQETLPIAPLSDSAAIQAEEALSSGLSPQHDEKSLVQVEETPAHATLTAPVSEPEQVVKAVDAGGYRALVVDDSPAIQKSLEINLVTLPQISIIDFADSGEVALEKAESMQYDLIFLDVMMPGIDGYETCTRLRKKLEYKKTPIIMVSGKTSPLDEVKGVMAGCTTYLTKPVQQEAFQKLSIRVLTWLEKQKKS